MESCVPASSCLAGDYHSRLYVTQERAGEAWVWPLGSHLEDGSEPSRSGQSSQVQTKIA